MTPEGGGGTGAMLDTLNEWSPPQDASIWDKAKFLAKKPLHYNLLTAPSTLMRDAIGTTNLVAHVNYLNKPSTRTQEQSAGIDPRNRIEQRQMNEMPALHGGFGERQQRWQDIEQRNPAAARDDREARNWAMQWDPNNVTKLEQQVGELNHKDPSAGYYVDWTQNRVQGDLPNPSQWGVISRRTPAPEQAPSQADTATLQSLGVTDPDAQAALQRVMARGRATPQHATPDDAGWVYRSR